MRFTSALCGDDEGCGRHELEKREQSFEETGQHADNKKAYKLDYSMNIEQMLDQETRGGKRKRMEEDGWMNEPTIDLGTPRIKSIRIDSLGPVLRRKFVHPEGL